MIKARPDLQDEGIKLYEIWEEKGMKDGELETIIQQYGSVEYKKHLEELKAEPEVEVCDRAQYGKA